MASDLRKGVISKIEELGVKEASKFFGVSTGTISNWASGKTSPSLEAVEAVVQPVQTEVRQEEVTWEGRKVMMLLPVYRSFSPDTHYTLFANYAKYGSEKIGLIMEKRTLIHESRNILVSKALKTEADWFIFCDDDMILPCGSKELFNGRYGAGISNEQASFNAITRIMSHPADKRIVGALYFGRHAKGKAQCASGFSSDSENDKLHSGHYKGLKAEDWVGTGFMKIHRSVLIEMQAAIDAGTWPELKKKREDSWYGFFTPTGVAVGEDVSFCRRAKAIGIQTYLDTDLICLHCGEKLYGPVNTK